MVDPMVKLLESTPALLRHYLHDHGVPWEFKPEQSRNLSVASSVDSIGSVSMQMEIPSVLTRRGTPRRMPSLLCPVLPVFAMLTRAAEPRGLRVHVRLGLICPVLPVVADSDKGG